MQAVITRLKPDRIREKIWVNNWPDTPNLLASQVKTKTLFSGISNGTDRNDLIGGNYATYRPHEILPNTFGYQNVGQVIEVGSDVKTLNIGDLVYLSQNHIEYCVVPEDSLLVKLTAQIHPQEAALLGMASTAHRSCRYANLKSGDKLLIVGAGCIGQMVAQIARHLGVKVTICDVDAGRLRLAEELGSAELVLNTAGDNWDLYIPDRTYQAAIDLAGALGMEDKLIAATVRGGTVLFIAGRFQINYTFNLGQSREITIKQNSHFDNQDLVAVGQLVDSGKLKIMPLIRDIVPVKDAHKIYEILRSEPQRLLGTVFDWTN